MATAAALGKGAFSFYRSQLSAQTTLTPEQEHDLALRWRAGEKEAGRKMIEACLPFVMTIALEYRRWGLPLEDIVQEGNIGLLKAADRFDPTRGCRLATYAAYWIRAEIREYVARGYRIVRLGSSKSERRALRAYRRTREKNPAALAKLSGVDLEMVIATGHTDSVGTDAYNQKLSERRAAAVKDYLVSKGIPSAKITTIGKGESQPVATNKTAEGRQKNRRVDIEFKGVRR